MIKSVYTYNKANWVTKEASTKGSTALETNTYTYYASGNQASKTESGGNLTLNYAYSAAGNRTTLTAAQVLVVGTNVKIIFEEWKNDRPNYFLWLLHCNVYPRASH